jgi:hypothetical protein
MLRGNGQLNNNNGTVMAYMTLPITGTCFFPTGRAAEFCLPATIDCHPTPDDGFIALCADLWNCNLCQADRRYYIPYYAGDKYILQLGLMDNWNPDPEHPVDGWGIFIKAFLINAKTGGTVSSNIADFASRYFVGWADGHAVQFIEIDTSKPVFDNLPCWNIQFKTYKIEGEGEEAETVEDGEYCSQHFQKERCELLAIESEHDTYDDLGQWYGEVENQVGVGGSFKYSNWTRIHATVTFTGMDTEKFIVGEKRAGGTSTETHIFETNLMVAPFMFRHVMGAVFSAYNVLVNEKPYICQNQAVRRVNKGSNMFQFSVNLQRITYQTTC